MPVFHTKSNVLNKNGLVWSCHSEQNVATLTSWTNCGHIHLFASPSLSQAKLCCSWWDWAIAGLFLGTSGSCKADASQEGMRIRLVCAMESGRRIRRNKQAKQMSCAVALMQLAIEMKNWMWEIFHVGIISLFPGISTDWLICGDAVFTC